MTTSIGGTTGITFNDASVQNTAATGFGFKNRIINGAMVIDQRYAGAAVSAATVAANAYLVDRFQFLGSQSAKFSAQQNQGGVTPPTGFKNYLGLTVASAVSLISTDYFLLGQRIEGFNIADLAWGTASAAPVTLSFRVYSSLTGTFGGVLKNNNGTRAYPFTYSIPTANTWTTISVTIAGDTSGTWLTDNSVGIYVIWGLGVGATYSGTAGAWGGADVNSATGAVSVVSTAGATFYITGVQLEKGSTATSFDYRPYGTELILCQRYFSKTYIQSQAVGTANGAAPIRQTSTGNAYGTIGNWFFPSTMRAVPTITGYAPGNGAAGFFNGDSVIYSQLGTHTPTEVGVGFFVSNNAIGANVFFSLHATASAEL